MFCNEHKPSVYHHERYYNYGFSRCYYHACNECRESLFGPFRLVDGGIMDSRTVINLFALIFVLYSLTGVAATRNVHKRL